MEIGKPDRVVHVEPAESPVPPRPVRVPQKPAKPSRTPEPAQK